MRNIGILILFTLLGVKGGYELAKAVVPAYLPAPAPVKLTPTAEPLRGLWVMPGCPRELTDLVGTRWSPPAWSAPDCSAIIMWKPR